MTPTEFRVHPDSESLAEAAANEIATCLGDAVRRRGRASVALAGGSTPRRAYELLARDHASVLWDDVHVFWSDERCVPPTGPDSNYGMAKSALLDLVSIPPGNVHRIRGEDAPPDAAAACERELRAYFGGGALPAFDLVLLGVGEDGHTASLFPGHPAVDERARWAVAVETEAKSPRWRVTLTLPVLCAARSVLFLASGAGKRPVIDAIRTDPSAAALRFPAAAVRPAGRLAWFVDEAAAGGRSTP